MSLTFYPAHDEVAPAFLVLPGGGYSHVADHEGAPVAEWLASLGIHAAVLRYPTGSGCWPRPLEHARAALYALRTGGTPLAVDPRRVGVCGFSAGAHLAGLLATDSRDVPKADPLTFAGRPDAAILSYPVTDLRANMGGLPNLHTRSADTLLGEDAPEELRAELSLATRVTPPDEQAMSDLFVWTTSDDETVPSVHALSLMTSLAVAGVPFEGHVFRTGRHGLGLADEAPDVAEWTVLAERWLISLGWV